MSKGAGTSEVFSEDQWRMLTLKLENMESHIIREVTNIMNGCMKTRCCAGMDLPGMSKKLEQPKLPEPSKLSFDWQKAVFYAVMSVIAGASANGPQIIKFIEKLI